MKHNRAASGDATGGDASSAPADARLQSLLRHLRTVVFSLDAEGRLLSVNPAWTEVSGQSVESSIARPLAEFAVPDDRGRIAEHLRSLARGSTSSGIEWRVAREKGAPRWVAMHARHDDAGRPHVIAGSLVDITDRKATEAVLEDRMQFFCNLFDCALDIIVVLEPDGRIQYVNEAVKAVLGYSPDALLGRSVLDLVLPDDRQHAIQQLQIVLNGEGDNAPIAFRLAHADGTARIIEANGTRIESGGQPRVLVTARDATERQRAEALRVAGQRLTDAALAAPSLEDLWGTVRRVIADMIPVHNLFIALYDHSRNLLSFPVWIDDRDPRPPTKTPTNGMTEWVLRSRDALHAPRSLQRAMAARGDIAILGSPSEEWFGVPLEAAGQIIGVFAVQTYEPGQRIAESVRATARSLARLVASAVYTTILTSGRQTSERFYESLAGSMPSGLLVLDLVREREGAQPSDALVLQANRSACALLETPPEKLERKRLQAALPDLHQKAMPRLVDTGLGGVVSRFEFALEHSRRVLDCTVFSPQGGRVVLLMDDITPRRQAEIQLARRDRILEALARVAERFLTTDLTPALVYEAIATLGEAADVSRVYIFENRCMPDHRILASQRYEWCAPGVPSELANPAMQDWDMKATGHGRWFDVLMAGDLLTGPVRTLPQGEREFLERQGIQSLLVVPIRVRGGFWGYFGLDECRYEREWSVPERDALRSAAHLFASALQRRSDEEKARVQNSALAAADNGIVISDREGHILWVNEAFCRLTGYTRDEVVGQNPKVLKSGVHDPEFYRELWATVLDGRVWRGEITNRRKDGSTYHEEMTITPVRATGGAITHFIAIKQDITEQLSLRQQLLQAQKMESVGRLAGGLAHDFNNLLQAITGFTSILLADLGDGDPRREDALEIEKAAQRAVALTRQLLAFSRKQAMQMGPLRLNEVVQGTEKLLRRLLGEGIAFFTRLEPSIPVIRGDAGQIEQVIVNLAVNARDAMPGGGTLTLETDRETVSADDIPQGSDAKPGAFVRLTIRDTGTGMTPDVRARLFEPFFSTKGVGKGTGLGLAVVYGIVQQHGGFIRVDTAPGIGTAFEILMPIPSTEPVTAEPVAIPASGSFHGHGERVLLLEDEPGVRDLAIRILSANGYRVTPVGTVSEAREAFARPGVEFDILLSDVVLPDGNGIRLAEELSAAAPKLRVLMSSAYAEEQARAQVIQQRGFSFLPKPYSAPRLLHALRLLAPREGE